MTVVDILTVHSLLAGDVFRYSQVHSALCSPRHAMCTPSCLIYDCPAHKLQAYNLTNVELMQRKGCSLLRHVHVCSCGQCWPSGLVLKLLLP